MINNLMLAKKIKKDFQKKLGNNLVSVFFYGSRAKNTNRRDSDLDLLLLMKQRPEFGSKEEKEMINITTKYLDDGIYVSAVPYGIQEYQKREKYTPVLHWIKKEGIKL